MKISKTFVKSLLEGFKKFAQLISGIINSILLFFVYFIGIGSTSIIAKIFGRHFLELKQNKKSYWVKHEKTKRKIEDYKRMF